MGEWQWAAEGGFHGACCEAEVAGGVGEVAGEGMVVGAAEVIVVCAEGDHGEGLTVACAGEDAVDLGEGVEGEHGCFCLRAGETILGERSPRFVECVFGDGGGAELVAYGEGDEGEECPG